MSNEQDRNQAQDRALPGVVHGSLGFEASHASDFLWRCTALRAGKLYSRTLFGTQREAEEFANRVREAEPDQTLNVEAIKASAVWN